MFGTFLQISSDDLDAIDKDEHECEEKLREVCKKWLQGNSNASWEDIIMALEKKRRYDIRDEISRKHP